MSSADATRSSPESRDETKLSLPGFMWMGKGDQRTFRGKVPATLLIWNDVSLWRQRSFP